MRRAPGVEKICTVCNEIGDIGDSMKGSSSPMKNKVGAQKGAYFIVVFYYLFFIINLF